MLDIQTRTCCHHHIVTVSGAHSLLLWAVPLEPEAEHMSASSEKIKNAWNCNCITFCVSMLVSLHQVLKREAVSWCNSFIHSVNCLTRGPKPPPKRWLHIVRSRASSFKWEYPLLFLRSSSSFLCLFPHLLATSISPFIFPSITCFRRQFLHKMSDAIYWKFIYVVFCLFTVGCRAREHITMTWIKFDISVGHPVLYKSKF